MRGAREDDQLRDDLRAGRARAVAAAEDRARRGAEFIEKYFERFQGMREYLDSMVAFAREHGYVQTIFKRRRYIPELRDRNFNIRAFGERTATNSPIQGSAADLIKIAMIRIHAALRARAASRRECCCRCTTSSCSRCRRASSNTSRRSCVRRCRRPRNCRCRSSSTSELVAIGSKRNSEHRGHGRPGETLETSDRLPHGRRYCVAPAPHIAWTLGSLSNPCTRARSERMSPRRRSGFSLIELFVVLVVIGILVGLAIPRMHGFKHQFYLTTMISDLRNLAATEEGYWSSVDSYSSDLNALRFNLTPGVWVTFVQARQHRMVRHCHARRRHLPLRDLLRECPAAPSGHSQELHWLQQVSRLQSLADCRNTGK